MDKVLKYFLDHPEALALFVGVVVMPMLSAIVSAFAKSGRPSLVAVSKILDGLGFDPMKVSRAILLLLGKAPTADELARAVNTVPPAGDPEDTETRLRLDDKDGGR